jgi:serine/threonine protein kinase/tetratricopeptide (TPR) repeat protein
MGEVYAAYDPELDRKIALKLLRVRGGDGVDPSEGRARLLREAQAIARLSDPNVVVVFDVGMFDDRVFLAMEFVDGHTLGYWLHAQPRRWQEVLKVFQKAGQGLASAHKAGIVHRDFKPDNVMISADGQVRVMDFGLARAITPNEGGATTSVEGGRRTGTTPTATRTGTGAGETAGRKSATLRATLGLGPAGESAIEKSTSIAGDRSGVAGVVAAGAPAGHEWSGGENLTRDLSRATALRDVAGGLGFDSPLTMTGAMMGTPAYMAPEQFRNDAVDARADQFAFCVGLYEALYSERPFKGKNIGELTAAVLAGKVSEAPSHTKVPTWLRKVVLRGLRVDRNERHPSMDALLAELRKDPAVKHRRWAVVGGVAMVVAVLAGGLVRAERRQRTRCLGSEAKLAGVWELPSAKGQGALSPRKEAIKKTFLATGKRYAADSFKVVTSALDRYVTDWTKMHRDSCEATNVRGEQSAEVLDLRTACLNDRLVEMRALTNVLAEANGEVVEKSVQATQSLRPIEQCADIAALKAVVKPPDDPKVRKEVAEVRSALAGVKALANSGKYKRSLELIGASIQRARATKYDAVIAEALLQAAELEGAGGERTKAGGSYEEALWLAESAHHDEVVIEAAAQLVWVSGYAKEYDVAERWARHAAAVLKRLGPGHDVIAGWRANNLATSYQLQGRFEDALSAATEAVKLKERALGSEHLDVAISLDNLSLALFRLGRVQEAIDANNRALKIVERTVGIEHPEAGIRLVNGAEFQNAAAHYDLALDFAAKALRIYERELEPDHPLVAYALTAMGNGLLGTGRAESAIEVLERALDIRTRKDPESELLAETRFALARALWETRRARERAISLATEAKASLHEGRATKDLEQRIDGWLVARNVRLSLR